MPKRSALQIPNELEQCQEMILRMHSQMESMQHQLELLLRGRYGPKAEIFNSAQLTLFTPESAEENLPIKEEATKPEAEGKKHGRGKPSPELPRQRLTYSLSEEKLACPDCGNTRKQIGEETSEQYEYVPASLVVIEHVQCKYACSKCKGQVIVAEGPNKPVQKGLAAAGMLAYVATSKFADHLPLHRLEGIFKRQGAVIARSTLCDWVAATAGILLPLYQHMRERVLASRIIWTDDTPVKLQDREDDRNMREARIWVYIGDVGNKFTVYDFTDSRKRDGPKSFLGNFHGYLQADAFAGYDCIYAAGQVEEVACMAHARRKFYDCLTSNEKGANEALEMIKQLYRIESDSVGIDPAQRRKVRLTKSAPLLYKLKKWLNQERLVALPQSPFGKAVRYALNNWRALCRFLKDGELTIDNNCSERAMRTIALGRKNWLFAGSKEGGKNAAIIASLIASCKHFGINPQQYLTDVLIRLSTGEVAYEKLLPGVWVPANL